MSGDSSNQKKRKRRILRNLKDLAIFAKAGSRALFRSQGGAIVNGISRALPIQSDTDLPQEVDVVVIGGGIAGICTALTLAERGVRVCVCEKGVVAGESSGRALGYIESQFLDPVKLEAVTRSKQLWEEMDARINGVTGYRKTGLATLFATEEEKAIAQGWLDWVANTPGMNARMISADEVSTLYPEIKGPCVGALYQEDDAFVDPQLAVPAMAQAVQRAKGTVIENCAVRGINTENGQITGVFTERGPITCKHVVLAGGAWSPVFTRSLGLDLPQFMAFASITRIEANKETPRGAAIANNTAMRPTLDGHLDACTAIAAAPVTPSLLKNLFRLAPAYKNMADQLDPVFNLSTFLTQWRIPKKWKMNAISPFEKNRILVPETNRALLDTVFANAKAIMPSIENAEVKEQWAGVLTSTPDNMPVISKVDQIKGLYICSGFYFGITMGPAAGEAIADLIMDRTPVFDLSLYRFERFHDGSDITFRF